MRLSVVSTTLIVVLVATAADSQTRGAKPAPAATPARAGMTNADVIKMLKAGLGEALVIASIKQAAKRSFTLTPDGLVELKTAGVSDTVIRVMMDPTATVLEKVVAPPQPEAAPPPSPTAPPAPAARPDMATVPEIGVYYKKDSAWADLLPEVVNWKTGGVLKHLASGGLVKGDVNGMITGARSRATLKQPVEILVYAADGIAITEYQLLRLRTNKDTREFRTVTGGVLHVSGGAARDLVPFESKKIAVRTYTLLLPNLGSGEYGILSPGAASASSASAQLGKIYTFTVE